MRKLLQAIELAVKTNQQVNNGRVCGHCHTALRKTADVPFIIHPVRVMRKIEHYVTEWEGGKRFTNILEDLLCIGALHDVCEDTDYPIAAIKDDFGDFVAEGVQWLTKAEYEPSHRRAARKEMERLRLSGAPDHVKVIKMWDRIDNLYDMIDYDWKFVMIYTNESRLLETVLRSADPELGERVLAAADWLESIAKGKK